ncbi:MAG TPA: hypothetical protein VM425_13480 [Myxococcota bacterium]|nr:hypothetical protein [Myxococcota bacterium]
MKATGWKIDQEVKKWLAADEEGESNKVAEYRFDHWLDDVLESPKLVRLGRVLVDPSVMRARFICVPERCAPWSERGRHKSCCADIYVPVTPAERRRLSERRSALAAHLARAEPRLRKLLSGKDLPEFYLDQDGDALSRPGGRCIFSLKDNQGRLRCRLYRVAKNEGIPVTEIQPFTCRIFPLVLVHLDGGRVLLTVLNRKNCAGFESYPPARFPCLADKSLPPLVESMSATLDWIFGRGFARALKDRSF